MRCPTSHGVFQCAREVGHAGECETIAADGVQGRIVTLDRDAQRELLKAARRIEMLVAVLRVIRTTFCASGAEGTACDCCRRARDFADGALK